MLFHLGGYGRSYPEEGRQIVCSLTHLSGDTRYERLNDVVCVGTGTVGTIIVSTTLLMGAGILTEAALGFLGFGVQPPEVSLGTLVNDYDGAYSTRPWLFIWPGVFVVGIVLCLQFIGDGLRDAFEAELTAKEVREDGS